MKAIGAPINFHTLVRFGVLYPGRNTREILAEIRI